jgi:hypothetical protein
VYRKHKSHIGINLAMYFGHTQLEVQSKSYLPLVQINLMLNCSIKFGLLAESL